MKQPVLYILLLFSLSIFLIPGCVPSKPKEKIEILPAERLVSRLESNRRRIKSFEGNGTIIIKTNKMNNSASFKIVEQKPDSIYLTIYGPFGISLAEALVTKNDFVFYDALHNTAYEGAVSEDVLRDIFKIDLSFSDLMDAFVGAVNLTKHLYKSPNKYSVDYDKYILTYVDSVKQLTTTYNVDIRNLGITKYQLKNNKGKTILEGKYSDFEYLENVAVPYKILVQNKEENQQVTINYKKMTANRKDISIDFKLPGDATIIKW